MQITHRCGLCQDCPTRPICRGSYARELPRSDCGADGEAAGALGLASTAAFGGVPLVAADSVVGAGAVGGAGGAAAAGACAPLAVGCALAANAFRKNSAKGFSPVQLRDSSSA